MQGESVCVCVCPCYLLVGEDLEGLTVKDVCVLDSGIGRSFPGFSQVDLRFIKAGER